LAKNSKLGNNFAHCFVHHYETFLAFVRTFFTSYTLQKLRTPFEQRLKM